MGRPGTEKGEGGRKRVVGLGKGRARKRLDGTRGQDRLQPQGGVRTGPSLLLHTDLPLHKFSSSQPPLPSGTVIFDIGGQCTPTLKIVGKQGRESQP